MATHYKQDCPLCNAIAEYCWVDARNRKYFNCPECSFFQISKRAEVVLAEKYQNRKSQYASFARQAPDNHLLEIRMPDHEFRQGNDDNLRVAFIDKSKLPLTCE